MFIRWAGSKRKLLATLADCWLAAGIGTQGKYIEAFMGSASLFFHLRPRKAVLGDLNTRLIDCFREVKLRPSAVSHALGQLPISEEDYYFIRALDEEMMAPHERAARFIYLNRFCYNGLYRTNKAGKFNVPYGGLKSGSLPDQQQLLNASACLSRASLACVDFDELVRNKAVEGDFVYLDPPYAIKNASLDMQYGPDNFGVRDLERMSALLNHLDSIGAAFVVSYADCDEAREHFGRWPSKSVTVLRTIAAHVSKRKREKEILVSNVIGWV